MDADTYDPQEHAAALAAAFHLRKVGNGWRGTCPACRDANPSLSLQVKDSRALVHCFAGCDFPAIAAQAEARGAPWPQSVRATWRGLTNAELSEARTILALAESDAEAGQQLSPEDAATVEKARETVTAGEVERLARLRPIERDAAIEEAAQRLGCRVTTLRNQVAATLRGWHGQRPDDGGKELAGRPVTFDEPEPWPVSIKSPEFLLDNVARLIHAHIVVSDAGADAAALWVLHTHCFRAFDYSPRFNIRSPLPGCGKSTFLRVIGALVAKPKKAENLTTAVIFRLIDGHAPTLLVDEYDSFLGTNEEMRGILNAGCEPGGTVLRCDGDENALREFKVFAPVALSGIRSLPGTLHDRSLVVTLQKAPPDEKRASFDTTTQAKPLELKRMLMRWAADNVERVRTHRPTLPTEAVNRTADKWRPIFALAELAGGDWPARARAALLVLNAEELDREDLAQTLLADLRDLFAADGFPAFLPSAYVVAALNTRADRPWKTVKHGKELDENFLAFLLKPFKVKPGKAPRALNPERPRGYKLTDLSPLFVRYLPAEAPDDAEREDAPGLGASVGQAQGSGPTF